jgi:hypothetical protein
MSWKKAWPWLLFFGSLWGLSEVSGGSLLYANGIPRASVFLSAWALFLLAAGRGICNRPGSSTLIGGVATAFKLLNTSPFICHLLAIFLLGVAFDITATFIQKKSKRISWKTLMTGIAGAYGGYALFAFIITYVVRYSFWVAGGIPKVANHILVGGSLAAALSLVLVPLGYRIGFGGETAGLRRPRWVTAVALAGVVIFWILGRISG